jgi:hypothetical protein
MLLEQAAFLHRLHERDRRGRAVHHDADARRPFCALVCRELEQLMALVRLILNFCP